jgi:hypothetical protein
MDAGYAIPTILVTAYPDDDVHQQTKLLLAARKCLLSSVALL